MDYEKMTEHDRDMVLMNSYVKALTHQIECIVITHSSLLALNDIQKANYIAHNIADNILANFACNFIKSKSANNPESIKHNMEIFKKRLDDWFEIYGKEEEEKKEMH